jgi:heme-degrading monooxygenase HmoA
MQKNIRHSVIFNFKDGVSPSDETAFFNAAKELAKIPGVQGFELLKQTSKKNPYAYGISMEFATQVLYEQYNNHPAHTQFIQNHWLKQVADFLEIDYEGME